MLHLNGINKGEIRKVIFTMIMMMTTVYIYSIVRNSKDILILSNASSALISSLKLYAVLPSAILMVIIYTKLLDYFSRLQMYYILNVFFLSFFLVFALFLYPNTHILHPDLSKYIEKYKFMKYILLIFSYWTYSLFYVMSELWGSMMLAMMFFQFCNQIYDVKKAKIIYPMLGFVAQIGLWLSGFLSKSINSSNVSITAVDPSAWQSQLNFIVSSVVIGILILMFCIWYISTFEISKDLINGESRKKKKIKMGLIDSFNYVLSSRYIRLITLLILCYGISINLVEGVWKETVRMQYISKEAIGSYFGTVQQYTAVATMIAMMCATFVIRLVKWRTAAIATPIMIALTGIGFFIFVIFREHLGEFAIGCFGISALSLAVILGLLQNVLSKATKYAFFDPTKEIAYIPLDNELKAKGKATADVIGGRLGKSGGAFTQQSVLFIYIASNIAIPIQSPMLGIAPTLFTIFSIIMIIWVYAVINLSIEFEKKNDQMKKNSNGS